MRSRLGRRAHNCTVGRSRIAPATSSSGSSRALAYAQRPDQRVRAGTRVEDPSFSGLFLGVLSTLHTHAYAGCARRDVAGEPRFPRRPARRCRPRSQSCVCTHRACVRTALINEISTGTAPEVVLGLAAVASRVRRSGRAFGARWFRSRLGTLQTRAVDRSGSAAQGRRLRSSPDQDDLLPPARRLAHRPTGAASSSKRLPRRRRCRRMGATLLEPVEGLAGDAPYSGGSPGFFSGGSYGNGAAREDCRDRHRFPFP